VTGPSRWRRWLVPPIVSERHAIRALLVGFLCEAVTEVYQLLGAAAPVTTAPLGYSLGLATTVVGFYFLWRGLHEWSRLPHPPDSSGPRPLLWENAGLFAGGLVLVALWNAAKGNVGAGDSPAPLAWVVGGVLVLAVGSFFLRLRRMAANRQGVVGRVAGWAAFLVSIPISAISGLVLGQGIVGLFVDFFTSWPALVLSLGPFVFAISPLCVAFFLTAIGYADAYRDRPAR